MYRDQHFETLKEKRTERRRYTKEHDQKLDRNGYERFKKDHRLIEEHIEKLQNDEKEHS